MRKKFRQDDAIDLLWLTALLVGGFAYIVLELTLGLAGIVRLLGE